MTWERELALDLTLAVLLMLAVTALAESCAGRGDAAVWVAGGGVHTGGAA